jgi:hypothetical protein
MMACLLNLCDLLKINGSNCKPAIQLRHAVKAPTVPFWRSGCFAVD